MGSSDTIPSATGRWGATGDASGHGHRRGGPWSWRSEDCNAHYAGLTASFGSSRASARGVKRHWKTGAVAAAAAGSFRRILALLSLPCPSHVWRRSLALLACSRDETGPRGPVAVAFIGKIFWPRFAPRSIDRPDGPPECRTGGQRQRRSGRALSPVTADSVVLLLGDVSSIQRL